LIALGWRELVSANNDLRDRVSKGSFYSRSSVSRKWQKNRKHQSAEIRFGPAVKAFLLCLLIAGSSLGYVWQKSQIDDLGQQIRKRELRLKDLQVQNDKLHRQLVAMRSPQYLQERIKEMNLGLVPSQPSQVWYLKEPVKLEATTHNRELASRQSTPVAVNE